MAEARGGIRELNGPQKAAVVMLAIGEETGQMDTMLSKVADFYEDEVEAAVKALTSMLEPAMIVIVGGIVGSILLAMYLSVARKQEARWARLREPSSEPGTHKGWREVLGASMPFAVTGSAAILYARADLLVYNGLELEIGWLPKLLEGARNASVMPGRPGNLDASRAIDHERILEVPKGEVFGLLGLGMVPLLI